MIKVDKPKGLLPCPFCGAEAEIRKRYHSDEGYTLSVGCGECFCHIKTSLWFDFNESRIKYETDKMVKRWNERV